jgi:hypothetical protein
MANLKYSRTRVTNQNCIHEEIKGRLNSESFFFMSLDLRGRKWWGRLEKST